MKMKKIKIHTKAYARAHARPTVTHKARFSSSTATAHAGVIGARELLPDFVSLSTLLTTKTYSAFVDAYTSWVFTCVTKIAYTIASLPFGLYIYRKNGMKVHGHIEQKDMQVLDVKREQIHDHPFLDLVNHPNMLSTRFTFWFDIIVRLELTGSCGIYLPKNRLGIPAEAWVLPLQKTATFRVIPDPKLIVKGYEYIDGSMKTIFSPDEILFLRYPHPGTPFEGMSPLKAQATVYDIDFFMNLQQKKLFENNAVPGMTLTTDQRLQKEQVDEIRTLIDSQFKGAARTGKPMVLHSGLKRDASISTSTRDLVVAQLYSIIQDKFLSSYGVPAGKLGLVTDVNRANMEAVDKMFFQETIKPRLMIIEEAFEQGLLPLYDDGLNLDFDLPEFQEKEYLLTEDTQMIDRYVYTVNEVRTKRGLPAVPWGDKPFIPITLTQFGENTPSPMAPKEPGAVLPAGNGGTKVLPHADMLWKSFSTRQERFESKAKQMLVSYFTTVKTDILSRFRQESGKIKGQFNGWGLNKVKKYLSETKVQALDAVNINTTTETEKLKNILHPIMLATIQHAGNHRIEELARGIHAKAESKARPAGGGLALKFSLDTSAIKTWITDRINATAESIAQTTFDDVAAVLKNSLGEGLDVTQIVDALTSKLTAAIDNRSPLIARTETAAAMNFADLESVKQNGLEGRLLKVWLTAQDADVRDTHTQAGIDYADGIPLEDTFKVGADEMDEPGNGDLPEENINCFVGDASIYSPNIDALFCSVYDGEVITIKTVAGHEITGTPNHPIFTDRGFIALGLLKKGDSIISTGRKEWESLGNLDVQNRPTMFKQKFDALNMFGRRVRISRANVNFYGDRPNSNVDIVSMNSQLLLRFQSAQRKPCSHIGFTHTDFRARDLLGLGLLDRGLNEERSRHVSDRFISHSGKPLSVDEGCMCHANKHALAFASDYNTMLPETMDDCRTAYSVARGQMIQRLTGGIFEGKRAKIDRGATDSFPVQMQTMYPTTNGRNSLAIMCSKIRNAFSVQVAATEIFSIHKQTFHGNVFTAQTHNGIYICNGIVAKNCRCSLSYISNTEE